MGPQGRRFFVIKCDSSINQDKEYFWDLVDFLGFNGERKGVKAWGHYLYSRIIPENWNPREIPVTQHLIDHKIASLDPVSHWWYNCLVDGKLSSSHYFSFAPGGQDGITVVGDWIRENVLVSKSWLYDQFVAEAKHMNVKAIPQSSAFFKRLYNLIPGVEHKRPQKERCIQIFSLHHARQVFVTVVTGVNFDGPDCAVVPAEHRTLQVAKNPVWSAPPRTPHLNNPQLPPLPPVYPMIPQPSPMSTGTPSTIDGDDEEDLLYPSMGLSPL